MGIDYKSENWQEQKHAEDIQALREASYYVLMTVDENGRSASTSLWPGAASDASVVHGLGGLKAEIEYQMIQTLSEHIVPQREEE